MSMVLEVQVTYSYGKRLVLRNVSFRAEEGTVVAVVGPNGAGKTTLLKCIAQVLRPQGVVYVDGRNLVEERYSEVARVVFSLFSTVTVPELQKLTVLDVLLMGRYPYRRYRPTFTEEDLRAVEEVAKLFSLQDLLDRYITELSDGERQRVLLARALVQNPRVLLLDEPVAHLDLRYQIELLKVIRDWCLREKRIVVMALHDLNLASVFSDKVLLLHRGEVVAEGSPEEVLRPEVVTKVYGTSEVLYLRLWRQYLLPAPVQTLVQGPKLRIHVFCGGGRAVKLLPHLRSVAVEVRCGPVPPHDIDAVVAQALGYRVYLREEPELRFWLSTADAVLVPEDNLSNFTEYVDICRAQGVPVIRYGSEVGPVLQQLLQLCAEK